MITPIHFLNKSKSLRFGCALSAALSLMMGLQSIQAASLNWTNASGGDFNTSTNWNPQASPGSLDTISFAIATSGPITSAQNNTVNSLFVNRAVTLDSGGHNFTVNGTSAQFTLASTGVITLQNGAYSIAPALNLDSSSGATTTFSVTGATTTFQNSTTTFIGASTGSNVQFKVQNGAAYTATSGSFYIGGKLVDNAQGVFEVNGAGSTANLGTNTVYVGTNTAQTGSSGTLKVLNGAQVTGGSGSYSIANGAGISGALLIDGSGSSLSTTGQINVAGISGTSGAGTGSAQVSNGATLTTTSNYYNLKKGTTYVGTSGKITSNIFYNGTSTSESAASLRGNGQVVAASIFMYGNVRPGDNLSSSGVGTLTLGSNTQAADVRMYQASSNAVFDFNSNASYDKIAIFGGMSVRGGGSSLGTLTLTFNYAPTLSDTFTIFTTTSGFGSGTFTNVLWEGMATGGTITYNANSIVLSNVIATVPEPSTIVLLLAGSCLLMIFMRRRLQRNETHPQ